MEAFDTNLIWFYRSYFSLRIGLLRNSHIWSSLRLMISIPHRSYFSTIAITHSIEPLNVSIPYRSYFSVLKSIHQELPFKISIPYRSYFSFTTNSGHYILIKRFPYRIGLILARRIIIHEISLLDKDFPYRIGLILAEPSVFFSMGNTIFPYRIGLILALALVMCSSSIMSSFPYRIGLILALVRLFHHHRILDFPYRIGLILAFSLAASAYLFVKLSIPHRSYFSLRSF